MNARGYESVLLRHARDCGILNAHGFVRENALPQSDGENVPLLLQNGDESAHAPPPQNDFHRGGGSQP